MAGITFSEGSGVADSFFGKSQAPIKAIIADRVESFQEQSMIDKVFYMDTTTTQRSTPLQLRWVIFRT